MGSKKSKKPAAELSKKERKALEEKAAHLEAEIERREKKAAKKALANSDRVIAADKKKAKKKAVKKGKKAKAEKPEPAPVADEAPALTVTPAAAEAKAARKAKREAKEAGDGEAVYLGGPVPAEEREAAEANAAAQNAEIDAAIKARVQAKRAAREAGEPVDVKAARMPDAREGETEVEYQQRRLAEKKAPKPAASSNVDKGGLVAAAEEHAAAKVSEAVEVLGQAIEIVETETGREFAAGQSVAAEEFAKPSEAPRELEEGRNGYKIIQLDAAGNPDPRKVRQMTRVTTFVGNIDDETTLRKWEKRKVVEGLALDALSRGDNPEDGGDPLIVRVNELAHRRDVAIAKAIKGDRKGKLGVGEVAILIADAEKVAKDALDAIVEEAAELAGRSSKARAGTHLHSLAEISDEKGIDEVRRMFEAEETVLNVETGEDVPITATDLASIEAYAERMTRLGAKVIESEAVIVNDEMGYAGRLDRVIMARLPELTIAGVVRPADQRARRYIADIKSGRVDLGAGKIARQLAAYALGDLYNLETGERSRHSAVRDIALVFHLPQGEGSCAVHAVDIRTGAALLKLSGEVRRARNTGRKTIDTSVDITDPAAPVEGAGDEEAAD